MVNFLLEAALRDTHLPSTPGTWSVNGSRARFMERGSPQRLREEEPLWSLVVQEDSTRLSGASKPVRHNY